jgi:glycosyltransferase involved in cell wall biosynthesis
VSSQAKVSAAMTSVSVVICAHTEERWEATLAAVASVRAQTIPTAEIILVVDHNPVLHRRLAATLPDLTVVENCQERGLSGGRNTGIAMATGDIVAFLDDDAAAEPTWLEFLAESYADPAVAGVGGLTRPRWQARRPSWFPDEFGWVVGCYYRGMPTARTPVRNLHGGNASFRREVFELVGGFRTGIGRSASKRPLGCEETELCIRLGQRRPESVLIFDDRAVIWHLVPPARCRFSYFWSRCFAEGISKAIVAAVVGPGDGLATERTYATRTLPRGIGRGLADAARGQLAGLGRAAAISAGLTAAGAGYLSALLRRRTWQDSVRAAPAAAGLVRDEAR